MTTEKKIMEELKTNVTILQNQEANQMLFDYKFSSEALEYYSNECRNILMFTLTNLCSLYFDEKRKGILYWSSYFKEKKDQPFESISLCYLISYKEEKYSSCASIHFKYSLKENPLEFLKFISYSVDNIINIIDKKVGFNQIKKIKGIKIALIFNTTKVKIGAWDFSIKYINKKEY